MNTTCSVVTPFDEEPPYLVETQIITARLYNPKYGDDRVCTCGHAYYRHFDSYEDMYPVGCKYCSCDEFREVGKP